MVAILVTGMSGTGKSTAIAELVRRGLRAVDTDDGYAFESWNTEEDRPEQLWHADRVERLLDEPEESQPLFLSGCASNQVQFYPRFAAVVLLTVPVDVMVHRLATRTTNPFGRSEADRARILADLAVVEPLLRAGADAEIDTRMPVADVADRLVEIARSAS